MSDSDDDLEPGSQAPKLAYNPDQNPDEKRRVRGNYRELQADLDGTPWNPAPLLWESDIFAA